MNRVDELKTYDSVPSVHMHIPSDVVPLSSSLKSTKKKRNGSTSASPRPARTPQKSSSNHQLPESNNDLFNQNESLKMKVDILMAENQDLKTQLERITKILEATQRGQQEIETNLEINR